MTREQAIEELTKLSKNDDFESAHYGADDVLCELLKSLGYADVVEIYDDVGKWYS